MTVFSVGTAFDLDNFLANVSLADFFEFGTPTTATGDTFVVEYTDTEMSERLTLTGTFGNYVDGYPTTGTITGISYWLDSVTVVELTSASITVEQFTQFVNGDDVAGLFSLLLAGDDAMSGSDGNDVLSGYSGNDVIEGGAGDDHLEGGSGHDQLRGGLGSDYLDGGDGDDFLSEGYETSGPFSNDTYIGGAGNDRLSYFSNDFGVTVDLRIEGVAQNVGAMGNDTLSGIEHITATYRDDVLIGNDAGNWFWTFGGTDNLQGNGGDDWFTVGYGNKIIDGGSGIDTVEINDQAYVPVYTEAGVTVSLLRQGSGQNVGTGVWTLTNIENLSGYYGADYLIGDDGANTLAGEGGNDRLVGNGGDDVLAGDGTSAWMACSPAPSLSIRTSRDSVATTPWTGVTATTPCMAAMAMISSSAGPASTPWMAAKGTTSIQSSAALTMQVRKFTTAASTGSTNCGLRRPLPARCYSMRGIPASSGW